MTNFIDEVWTEISDDCIDHMIGMVPELPDEVAKLSDRDRERIRSMSPDVAWVSKHGDDPPGEVDLNPSGSKTSFPLGSYAPMSSPGKITLYPNNLGGYFWHIVEELLGKCGPLTREQVRLLASATAYVTYLHERFHHYCDLVRRDRGTSSSPDRSSAKLHTQRLAEEGMAVAMSWYGLHYERRSAFGAIPDTVWKPFVDLRFTYDCAGYGDWPDYRHCHIFADGVDRFLGLNDAIKIASSSSTNPFGAYCALEGIYSSGNWNTHSVVVELVPNLPNSAPLRKTPEIKVSRPKAVQSLHPHSEEPYVPSAIARRSSTAYFRGDRADSLKPVDAAFLKGSSPQDPREIYCCHNPKLDSLASINTSIKKLNGTLCMYGSPIRSHLLGLLLIEELNRVVLFDPDKQRQHKLSRASQIVNQHLWRGREGLIDCQHELYDEGLEEYGQL